MKSSKTFFALALLAAAVMATGARAWGAEADSGRDLYVRYCASCHGVDGKGAGPVSRDLTVKIPDLTALKKNNKGIYPAARIMSAIDGTRRVRGHGDAAMPVWGEVFKQELKDEKYRELTTLRKTQAIADYVATLQR